MIRIDGTATRSNFLLLKANTTVSTSVQAQWREAYLANEACRARFAHIQRNGCGCGC